MFLFSYACHFLNKKQSIIYQSENSPIISKPIISLHVFQKWLRLTLDNFLRNVLSILSLLQNIKCFAIIQKKITCQLCKIRIELWAYPAICYSSTTFAQFVLCQLILLWITENRIYYLFLGNKCINIMWTIQLTDRSIKNANV